MSFSIRTREATAGTQSGPVYELSDAAGQVRAEVWPFFGFNCLRWQVQTGVGWGDLLYTAPDWETNPVPTRSGHPILFPFPNRMFAGKFPFRGREYQLPLNESTGKHAIHGFTPRAKWDVIWADCNDNRAAIRGLFRVDKNIHAWPGNLDLEITYSLYSSMLRVDAAIRNTDTIPVPCGLGFHPYFCLPAAPGAQADAMVLGVYGATLWPANEGIPTGESVPVPFDLDFREPKPVGDRVLDRLFGELGLSSDPSREMTEVSTLQHSSAPGQLRVSVSASYREVLLFTPPHRQAIAIEPYTCTSDAANQQSRGVDSGWMILPPGGVWNSAVEYAWNADFRNRT